MKYGMNLLLWMTDPGEPEDPETMAVLEMLKGLGYDGVEVPMFGPAKPERWDQYHTRYGKWGRILDQLGLERTAVTICTEETNPIAPDRATRAAALDHLTYSIDCCAVLGANILCGPIHSALGCFSGNPRTDDEWTWGKDTLREAAVYAATKGVTLVVEYLNRFECYFLNCAADTARFCREVEHPNLRVMYDTFHANIEEKDITEAIQSLEGSLAHVHISANDRATPGDDSIDWDETFDELHYTAGYDGWLTVEAFGSAMPDLAAATKIWRRMFESEEQLARDALEFMREEVSGRRRSSE